MNIGLAVLAIRVVGSRIHQFFQFGLIANLDLGEPTASIGLGVKLLWGVGECLVHLEDFSADWENHFGCGFDGFDCRKAVSGADFVIRVDRKFNENDV